MSLFGKLVADHVGQARLDLLHLGEMHKDGTRHQVKLLHVRIFGVLASLVVDHVGGLAVHDQQVYDPPPPHVLSEEAARLVAFVRNADTQFQLGMLLTGEVSQRFHYASILFELRRDGCAVLDVQLGSFMEVGPILGSFPRLVLHVLDHLQVEVLLRTLLEGLYAAVGPSGHNASFICRAALRT